MSYGYGLRGVVPGLCVVLCSVALALGQVAPEGAAVAQPQSGTEVEAERALGQLLYVPAYSHIYYYNDKRPYLLAVTLSIRNTDVKQPLRLTSVRYVDSHGVLVQEHITQPVRLGPLASTKFFIPQRDTSGGAGAAFLVEWQAEKATLEPIVEAVMVGISGTQAISFVRPAKVLRTKRP